MATVQRLWMGGMLQNNPKKVAEAGPTAREAYSNLASSVLRLPEAVSDQDVLRALLAVYSNTSGYTDLSLKGAWQEACCALLGNTLGSFLRAVQDFTLARAKLKGGEPSLPGLHPSDQFRAVVASAPGDYESWLS